MLKKQVDPELEAKQLEWAKKKWVWVPDQQAGCLAAHVIKESGNEWTVKMGDGNERVMNKDDIDQMNPPKFEKCDDMATLTHLNESSVLHNLTDRYKSNLIYTYSGLFLVVINPWRRLPLYTDEVVALYKGKKRKDLPPHVFAVCDEAYRDMLENKDNQSLLITGESGAGKTENTKKVIQYLASVAGASQSTGMQAGTLEKQIVKTNPLLESFGNAKTTRNNNSSRFGKFIRIEFGSDGKIVGCLIDNYLLEKSRVVRHGQLERNFHIFYQLLDGSDADTKKKYHIGQARDYKYLLGVTNVDGVDNAKEFTETIEAMDIIGFTDEEKSNIWSIISGILQFGNLNFTQGRRDDSALLAETSYADKCAEMLGIKSADLQQGLLKPRVKAGRDIVTAMVTAENAFHSCDALAKTTYERLFKWIVQRINAALEVTSSAATFIGCLDIAGFEIFETNSFEQLCINLTNEKLQQFFNHHMFVLEQEEYTREGIEWKFIDFGLDLQPTIDLIEKPLGIMSILDEQCLFPKATDKTFIQKLHDTHDKKSEKYASQRLHPQMFSLVHYAGTVDYSTESWLEKNKDPINDNVAVMLSRSENKLIQELFNDIVPPEDESKRRKGAAFVTVSQRHRTSLGALMTTLFDTTPHFVRCIIPNEQKKAGLIEAPLVLDQLRCNGVLEGIRIVRMGFPTRLPFQEFRQRYEILAVGAIPKGFIDGRDAALKLVAALKIKTDEYRVGLSKIFFKAGVIAEIEELRDTKLGTLITGFQAVARGFIARQQFRREHGKDDAIKVIQRNARVFIELYNWPWWKLYRQVKPLLSIYREEQAERALLDKIKELETQVAAQVTKREDLEKERGFLLKENEVLEAELATEKDSLDETLGSLKRTQEGQVELEGLVRELEEQLDEAELATTDLQADKNRLNKDIAAVTEALNDESEVLAAIETAKREKDAEFEALDRQAKADRERLEAELEADKDRLENQITALKSELSGMKAQLERQRKQAKQLQAERDELQASVEQSENAKHRAEKAVQKIEIELEAAKSNNAALSAKSATLAESKRNNESELAKLKAKLGQLETSKSTLETQSKNLEEEFETLSKKSQESQSAKASADRVNKGLELELDEFADKLGEATDQAKEFEIKAGAAQKEVDEKNEALIKAKAEVDAKLLEDLKAQREKAQDLEAALMAATVRRSVAEETLSSEGIKLKQTEAKMRELRELLRH